jgi:diadenosine tetraphosphate (Ap4A) HIT family hydrolase
VTDGWPADWDAHRRGNDCPMCGQERADRSPSGNIRFFAGQFSDAYLALRAVQRGYAIVIWRGRHVAHAHELDEDEQAGWWSELMAVSRAVEQHFGASIVNVQMLGNGVPHLHAHVSARFRAGDVNPRWPLPFADLPELDTNQLEADAARLRTLLAERWPGRSLHNP